MTGTDVWLESSGSPTKVSLARLLVSRQWPLEAAEVSARYPPPRALIREITRLGSVFLSEYRHVAASP